MSDQLAAWEAGIEKVVGDGCPGGVGDVVSGILQVGTVANVRAEGQVGSSYDDSSSSSIVAMQCCVQRAACSRYQDALPPAVKV